MSRFSLARASLLTVGCVVLLHWITSCRTGAPVQSPTASASGAATSTMPGAPGPCDSAPDPAECFLQRAAVIEDLLGDLYELEAARDQRSVPAALDAVATGELDVQVVAFRVLAPFAGTPGVGAKVLPWLLADDPRREEGAAAVLGQTGDPGFRRLAAQFAQGHEGENKAPDLAGWWRDPSRHGLRAYPNATRFPPGDSARSIGLLTDDPVDRVLAHYQEKSSPPPFDAQAYQQRAQAALEAQSKKIQEALQSSQIVERQKQIQALMEEYQKTQDPKILEKVEKLGQTAMPEPEKVDPGALALPLPTIDGGAPMSQARFLVIEERAGVPARAVVAYPEPAVGKTVVILGFDPKVYGGAADPRRVRLR